MEPMNNLNVPHRIFDLQIEWSIMLSSWLLLKTLGYLSKVDQSFCLPMVEEALFQKAIGTTILGGLCHVIYHFWNRPKHRPRSF